MPNRRPYYIGVDQSLQHTGVALYDPVDEVLVLHTIRPKNKGPARLLFIQRDLEALLRKYLPEGGFPAGALESGSFQSSGRLYQLGGVNGIVQVELAKQCQYMAEVAPSQLKKYVTRKGGAQKDWVIKDTKKWVDEMGIRVLLTDESVSLDDDNVADAVGLARIARALHCFALASYSPATRAEAEVVDTIGRDKKAWWKLR